MDNNSGVARVRRIDQWLADVGLDENIRGDIAVDLADILAAARRTSELLDEMMAAGTRMSANESLTKASEIEVQIFSELASHLDTLRESWSVLLDHLAEGATVPPMDPS